jgi:citrate lyase alpha subunit
MDRQLLHRSLRGPEPCANPRNRGAVVNQRDTMILGAAEVDVNFNVNVTTGADGIILGGSGGHADATACWPRVSTLYRSNK